MAKVTGIGGVFFKSKDAKALVAWYEKHLGIKIEVWGGAVLRWKEDGFSEKGVTAWNIEPHESNKFAPSQKLFMVNYRVDDLNEMLADLQKAGVEILKTEFGEYGKFAWVMDPDGNKVELWEP